MSIEHDIDIVAGIQSNSMSQRVRGIIRIDTGDPAQEAIIRKMYRKTDKDVYKLMTGLDWVDSEFDEII